ncbi:hypothetical protein VPH35_072550 [Triticum aestivum]
MEPNWPLPLHTPPALVAPNASPDSTLAQQLHLYRHPSSSDADISKYAAGAAHPPSRRHLLLPPLLSSDAAAPLPTTSCPYPISINVHAGKYAVGAVRPPSAQCFSRILLCCRSPITPPPPPPPPPSSLSPPSPTFAYAGYALHILGGLADVLHVLPIRV